jgi:hypothetical protein
MPRVHPLAVEAVAQVEPDRERVVADPLVEPAVDPATDALERSDVDRVEVVLEEHADAGRHPRRPFLRRGAGEAEREGQPAVEALRQAVDDPAVEEHARRERVGDHDPDGPLRHVPVRPGRASATRSASEAPSSAWWRKASVGVPQAGQPSTPATRSAGGSGSAAKARRSVSPSAPTGA